MATAMPPRTRTAPIRRFRIFLRWRWRRCRNRASGSRRVWNSRGGLWKMWNTQGGRYEVRRDISSVRSYEVGADDGCRPGHARHERLDITQVIVRDSGRVARSGRRRPGHLRLPRAPQCRRQHGDPHTCDDTTPEAIRPARGCIPAPVSAMMTAPYGTAATSRAGVRARRSDAGSTMPLDATDRLRAYRGGMVVCPSRRPNSGGGPRAAARLGGLALTVQRFRRQHTEGMTRDTHG